MLGNSSSNPKDIFDKTENDLINKTISKIRNDDIEKIIIDDNNNTYALERDNNNWLKTWNNTEVKANDIYSSIFDLSNLNADGVITNENIKENNMLYKINIQSYSNDNISYEVLNNTDSGKYEIIRTNDNNRYYIDERSFSNFMQSVNNIIK